MTGERSSPTHVACPYRRSAGSRAARRIAERGDAPANAAAAASGPTVAAAFASLWPREANGTSLGRLDPGECTFVLPMSPMVHSPAFAALPEPQRERVLARLRLSCDRGLQKKQELRAEMEAEPVRFVHREGEDRLDEAHAILAAFVGEKVVQPASRPTRDARRHGPVQPQRRGTGRAPPKLDTMVLRPLLAVAFVLPTLVAQDGPVPQRPPNVVFVLADDLGYGELGCYGQQKIATPNLDRLAAQGTRLTHHYSGSPVCAPSRCVLMTGRHPGHAAVRDNKEAQPEGQWPLPAGDALLPAVLHDAGYATGAFGKWGLGMFGSSGDPLARGFDRFYGYNCQRHAHSYWPAFLYDDARRVPLGNEPPVPGAGKLAAGADPNDRTSYAKFVGSDYAPDRILAAATAFVAAHGKRPFFLFFPTPLPHLALHVPAADLKPYEGAFAETPYTGANGYTPHPTPRAAYAAMITRLDRDVGALLKALDDAGCADDTIVVFTSDNGATHSPVGGTDVDFFASCGTLRGRKGSMYEGGIRVPAIVRWPGRVPAGTVNAYRSGFEDWLPTLAQWCGAQVPAGRDGLSLAATLTGKEQAPRPFLYREFAGYGGWQAVWVGDEKLVRRQLQQPAKATTELYDLAADEREANDLAAARADRVQALLAILAREHVPSATFPLAAIDGAPK